MSVQKFGMSVHMSDLSDAFFDACRDAGVYSVEISLSPAQYPMLDWDTVADAIHKRGLIINSVHLPFSRTVNIAEFDRANRDATMELDHAVMRAAAAHGTKIAVDVVVRARLIGTRFRPSGTLLIRPCSC